jgi:hypothetical protein
MAYNYMRPNPRPLVVGIALVVVLAVAGYTLWYHEVKFRLPTPVPADFKFVPVGSRPALTADLPMDGRPALLHFYNPKCPCSRFNIDHLNELKTLFSDRVQFFAVLQTDDTVGVREKFASRCARMPTYVDYTGAVADSFGVYSTPQAVILNPDGSIYFRGNYNTSRYCSTYETQFVRIALDSLLAGKAVPRFPPVATTPYGCELPSDRPS